MNWGIPLSIVPLALVFLGGCAGSMVPPEAQPIGSLMLAIESVTTTQRRSLVGGEDRSTLTFVLVMEGEMDSPPLLGRPRLIVERMIDADGVSLLAETRYGDDSEYDRLHELGNATLSRTWDRFGRKFHLGTKQITQAPSHLDTLAATVYTIRLLEEDTVTVPLGELTEMYAVTDRLAIKAAVTPRTPGRISVDVDYVVRFFDDSDIRPDLPLLIEILANDGSVLNRPGGGTGENADTGIFGNREYRIRLPKGRTVESVRITFATHVGWEAYPVEFRDVPVLAPITRVMKADR